MGTLSKKVSTQEAATAVCAKIWGSTTTLYAKVSSPSEYSQATVHRLLMFMLVLNSGLVTADHVARHSAHVARFSRQNITWDRTGFDEYSTARPDSAPSHSDDSGSNSLHERATIDRATGSVEGISSHTESMVEGIAQELFFADNEFNFHDAKTLDWFSNWAQKHNNEFLAQRMKKPGHKLAVDTFFVDKFFGHIGRRDFHCDEEGCKNYPSNDEIKVGRDRHEARHIINVLRGFRKANTEVRQYSKVLELIKPEVISHCQEFAEVFFHGQTKAKTAMCVEDAFRLILLIAMAVAQAGQIWETLMPARNTLIRYIMQKAWQRYQPGRWETTLRPRHGFSVFYHGPGIVWDKLSGQYPTFYFALTREVLHYKPPLGGLPQPMTQDEVDAVTVYNQFLEDSLSKDLPVPRQKAKPDSPDVKYEYGGFGLMEALNTTGLNDDESSVYDQTQVASAWNFMKFPRPFPKQKLPTSDSSSADENSDSDGGPVHRMTRLFDITKNTAHESVSPVLGGEFSAIMRRLVHKDKSPMNLKEVLDFFEENVRNITARYQELRSPVAAFPADYLPIHQGAFVPKVKISPADQHVSWSSLISGLELDQRGATSDDRAGSKVPSNSGSLQWRAKHAGRFGEKQKRGVQLPASGHIKHEITGTLNALEALNLLSTSSGDDNIKRSTRKWAIKTLRDRDTGEDVFIASVNGHPFHNEVYVQDCGRDTYTGDTKQNKLECEVFIHNAINRITSRLSAAYTTANWDSPIKMASYLQAKFATYSIWHNADQMYEPGVRGKIKDNLENALVSKAYADGNCFVRCGHARGYRTDVSSPSVHFDDGVSCQTGCYDHTRDTYERLYGFNGPLRTSQGKATKDPWNLDEKRIINASAEAYRHRSSLGFVPGTAILNPYVPLTQDISPILPVCYSELQYQDKLVCSCGNRYGDMATKFAKSVNLRAQGKHNEWAMIRSCLDQIKHLAYHSPAAYLINACNVIYEIVTPPGTGSQQEYWGLGHYEDNMKACKAYQTYYWENKHLPDAELDEGICVLWGMLSKDWDRGPNHKHPDFSYVNDMLQDHGCCDYVYGLCF